MKSFAVLALTIVSLLVSCAGGKPAPIAIDEKVDICVVCNMFVGDNGYAGELFSDKGRVYKFDDAGELLAYQKDHPELRVVARYVQDRDTKEWLELDSAFWAFDKSVPTPMDFGLHAFSNEAQRRQFLGLHASARAINLDQAP